MSSKKKIVTSIIINARKTDVWHTLYNRFGDISIFNPNLTGSYLVSDGAIDIGSERRCDFDANTYIKETITAAKEQESISIKISDGNMPFLDEMDATMSLQSVSEKETRITAEAWYNTKPSFMATLMTLPLKKRFKDMLIGLKYYQETGKELSKETYKPILKTYRSLLVNQSFT